MPPDSTPFASWPRHFQESWRDCVERGEVDAQNPPDSLIEAYLFANTCHVCGVWGR